MKSAYIFLLLGLLAVGCKKNSPTTPAAPEEKKPASATKADTLTNGKWMLTMVIRFSTFAGAPYIDTLDLSDCELDNTITFRKDNVLLYDDGPLGCSGPPEPLDSSSRWSLINDKWLYWTDEPSHYDVVFELLTLHDSLLVWQQSAPWDTLQRRTITYFRKAN